MKSLFAILLCLVAFQSQASTTTTCARDIRGMVAKELGSGPLEEPAQLYMAQSQVENICRDSARAITSETALEKMAELQNEICNNGTTGTQNFCRLEILSATIRAVINGID